MEEFCCGTYNSLSFAKIVCAFYEGLMNRTYRIAFNLENVCENLEGVALWKGKSLYLAYIILKTIENVCETLEVLS